MKLNEHTRSLLEPQTATHLRLIRQDVIKIVEDTYGPDRYSSSQGVILISDAHCPIQDLHTDMNACTKDAQRAAERITVHKPGCLSALVAIEPGTSLHVIPGSHLRVRNMMCTRMDDGKGCTQAVQVHIPVGCVLLFCQDLLHGGSTYSSHVYHIRYHMFLNTLGLPREPGDRICNVVWLLVNGGQPNKRICEAEHVSTFFKNTAQ